MTLKLTDSASYDSSLLELYCGPLLLSDSYAADLPTLYIDERISEVARERLENCGSPKKQQRKMTARNALHINPSKVPEFDKKTTDLLNFCLERAAALRQAPSDDKNIEPSIPIPVIKGEGAQTLSDPAIDETSSEAAISSLDSRLERRNARRRENYKRNQETRLRHQREYHRENKETINAARREHYSKNRETLSARWRENYHKRKAAKANDLTDFDLQNLLQFVETSDQTKNTRNCFLPEINTDSSDLHFEPRRRTD